MAGAERVVEVPGGIAGMRNEPPSGEADQIGRSGPLDGADRAGPPWPSSDGVEDLRALSVDANRLIVVWAMDRGLFHEVTRSFPETRYVILAEAGAEPNVTYLWFEDNESAYLAGAAAALKSGTGTIGFVGGVDTQVVSGSPRPGSRPVPERLIATSRSCRTISRLRPTGPGSRLQRPPDGLQKQCTGRERTSSSTPPESRAWVSSKPHLINPDPWEPSSGPSAPMRTSTKRSAGCPAWSRPIDGGGTS
jgi:hypothetical protein